MEKIVKYLLEVTKICLPSLCEDLGLISSTARKLLKGLPFLLIEKHLLQAL